MWRLSRNSRPLATCLNSRLVLPHPQRTCRVPLSSIVQPTTNAWEHVFESTHGTPRAMVHAYSTTAYHQIHGGCVNYRKIPQNVQFMLIEPMRTDKTYSTYSEYHQVLMESQSVRRVPLDTARFSVHGQSTARSIICTWNAVKPMTHAGGTA